MLSIGSSLRSVPSPSSEVIVAASQLLASLGGGNKHVKKSLEEMLEIQKHNEEVRETAKNIIEDIARESRELKIREDSLKKSVADFDANMAERSRDMAMVSGRLAMKEKTFDVEAKKSRDELSLSLQTSEDSIKDNRALRVNLARASQDLAAKTNVCAQRLEQIEQRETRLAVTIGKLKSIFTGLE